VPLSGLFNKSLKLIFFGGKGGVGKTTCSASTALYLAEKGVKTLLFSTDPAHSLSDSLGQKIGEQIKQVKGVENLDALEISAEKSLVEFKREHEEEIREILETGTYLDEEDISQVLSLSIPGLDEVMGFKTIIDLMGQGEHDKYIVDTAPTGHALRLLSFPELLDDWIKVMAKIRWKYRYMVQSFSGRYDPDKADDLLLSLKKTVKKMQEIFKDPDQSEFIVVTVPEEMVVSETSHLVKMLKSYKVPLRHLVVNHIVLNEDHSCSFCRERRSHQLKYIEKIKLGFGDLEVSFLPLLPYEVRGLDRLREFGKRLIGV
jgi:arsenite-transporting ATPase